MTLTRILVATTVLALLMLASGCSDDKSVQPLPVTFVVTGTVSNAGSGVADAVVTLSTATAQVFDSTDTTGAYELFLTEVPDSARICVEAAAFADTCADFVPPTDSLVANWSLATLPPRDTVWLSADTVLPGETAVVTLSMSNPDSTVASFNLWIQSAGSGIVYDTVELVTPRFPPAGMEWVVHHDDTLNLISITLVDYQGVVNFPPGTGPLMRIRYSVDGAQAPGSYGLDTSAALLFPGSPPLQIGYASGVSSPNVAFVRGTVVVE
jgi:hypothetical protein